MTEDMPEDVKAAARNWVAAVDQRFTLADSFMPWAREYLEEVAAMLASSRWMTDLSTLIASGPTCLPALTDTMA